VTVRRQEKALQDGEVAPPSLVAAGRPEPVRRGIVVVHGIGQQERGGFFDTFVEALVAFLAKGIGHEHVRMQGRAVIGDGGIAVAVIRLSASGDDREEEWTVREAWWAESFRPGPSATVLAWGLRAFWAFVWALLEALRRNVRDTWDVACGGAARKNRSSVWRTATAMPDRNAPWQAIFGVGNVLVWLVTTIVSLIAFLLGGVLTLLLYALLLLPLRALLPSALGQWYLDLTNLLTLNVGDQQAMTQRRVAVAEASDVVREALWPFLAPEGPRSRGTTYETVTLIAHSGGVPVTYEALVSDEVRGWLSSTAENDSPAPRLTWITVGSGLNIAWRMHAGWKARDKAFFARRLYDPDDKTVPDRVNWIDMYARYDPVPHGPPPPALVDALMGKATASKRPYVEVRVVNDDLPLTDHGAYWWNFEEAMSRMVYAIIDSRLGTCALDPDAPLVREGATAVATEVRRAVERRLGEATGRRRRVSAGHGLLALAALLAVLLSGVASVAWNALASQRIWPSRGFVDILEPASALIKDGIRRFVPATILGLDLTGVRDFALGAGPLILAVVAAYLVVVRPLLSWYAYLLAEDDDPSPTRGDGLRAYLESFYEARWVGFFAFVALLYTFFLVAGIPDVVVHSMGYENDPGVFERDVRCLSPVGLLSCLSLADAPQGSRSLEGYINDLGEQGRRALISAHLLFDIAYPVLYSVALSIGIVVLVRGVLGRDDVAPREPTDERRIWWPIYFVPLLIAVPDLIENAGLIVLAWSGQTPPSAVRVVDLVSTIKGVFFLVVLGGTAVLAVAWAGRRIQLSRADASRTGPGEGPPVT
jgi:hypothetical protein